MEYGCKFTGSFSNDTKPSCFPKKSDFLILKHLANSLPQTRSLTLCIKIPAIPVIELIRKNGGPGPTKTIMNTVVTNILEGQ